MKKIFVCFVVFSLLLSQSFAAVPKIALRGDVKTGYYNEQPGTRYDLESGSLVTGLGVGIMAPIGGGFSWLVEGNYNSQGTYINSTGTRALVQIFPIELSLRKDFQYWYTGLGINYSLWSVNNNGTDYSERNSISWQLFAGWRNLFMRNLDIEVKFSGMRASTDAGTTFVDQSLGLWGFGLKYWIPIPHVEEE